MVKKYHLCGLWQALQRFLTEQKGTEEYEHCNFSFRCLSYCQITAAYGNAIIVNVLADQSKRAISSSMYC